MKILKRRSEKLINSARVQKKQHCTKKLVNIKYFNAKILITIMKITQFIILDIYKTGSGSIHFACIGLFPDTDTLPIMKIINFNSLVQYLIIAAHYPTQTLLLLLLLSSRHLTLRLSFWFSTTQLAFNRIIYMTDIGR